MDYRRLTEHRSGRRAPLTGAALLLLVASVAGVAACQSDAQDSSGSGDLKSFREHYTDQCESLTGKDNAAQLGRIVPDARTFGTSGDDAGDGKRGFSARCAVTADGKRAVGLTVEPARSKEDWQADVVAQVKWGRGQERLDSFGGGYASGSAAALYVPCRAGESRQRALGVVVSTPPGGHHKKDLTTLAKRTAERSLKRAGC